MAASFEAVRKKLSHVAAGRGYGVEAVSWNDVSRGVEGDGTLSAMGPNITDAMLVAKDGRPIYIVRSDNWNERLGLVKASDVILVVGNHIAPTGGNTARRPSLYNITLDEYLNDAGDYAAYAGIDSTMKLGSNKADELVSVRFQTCFLPLEASNKEDATAAAAVSMNRTEEDDNKQQQSVAAAASIVEPDVQPAIEFCPIVYNHNTQDALYPANFLLCATAGGTSFQQDMKGHNPLYLQYMDIAGNVYQYWLEAERTRFAVGEEQAERNDEIVANEKAGKSSTMPLGIPAMHKRMNVLLTIQIPICADYNEELDARRVEFFKAAGMGQPKKKAIRVVTSKTGKHGSCKTIEEAFEVNDADEIGVSSAARISRGSRVDGGCWGGVVRRTLVERDATQRVTVTIINFNCVVGGIPSEQDVLAAIHDLDMLYASCAAAKNRADVAEVNKPMNAAAAVAVAEQQQIAAQQQGSYFFVRFFSTKIIGGAQPPVTTKRNQNSDANTKHKLNSPPVAPDYLAALQDALKAFGSVRISDIESRFQKLRRLGQGTFGCAFAVRQRRPDGRANEEEPVQVLKEILKTRVSSSEASVQHVCAELAVTGLVAPGHPFLNKRTGLYHDETKIYILLEMCGGPRPDVVTRVAHVIAKRKPSRLPEFDDILDGLKAKARAASVDWTDEEAFGDFVDRTDCTYKDSHGNDVGISYIDRIAIDCGLRTIDEGNFSEMPVGNSLFNVIVAPRTLSDEHNRIITRQLMQGFAYLHASAVVNRDVKPENIMVSVLRRAQLQRDQAGKVSAVVVYERYHCHIIDFGLAKVMRLKSGGVHDSPGVYVNPDTDDPYATVAANGHGDDDDVNELLQRAPGSFPITSSLVGSHAYLSLETANGILSAIRGHQPRWETTMETLPKLDVWAVGACQFAVANGSPPFKYNDQYRKLSSEEKLRQIRDAILKGLQFRPPASAESRRFSSLIMEKDVTKRPTAEEALRDPYINHNCTTVRTEIHANGVGNRCQMMKEFPAEVAAAVLRDVSNAKRADFPSFMLLNTVKSAFAGSHGGGCSSGRGAGEPTAQADNSIGATAAAVAAADDDGSANAAALRQMGNALRGMRVKEEGVDEDKAQQ